MCKVDPAEFSARLQHSDEYVWPSNDVEDFTRQLEQSVIDVEDLHRP